MDRFYVYEHTRNDSGLVFYVGKGVRGRAYQAGRGRRNPLWHQAVAASGGYSVRMVAVGLPEELAHLVEVERIAQLRASGVSLCNQTDGGEGCAGMKRSDQWKSLMSRIHKGKIVSAETRRKISDGVKRSGYMPSEEQRRRLSEAHLGHRRNVGRKASEATRLRMSEAQKGNKSRTGQSRSAAERAKVSAAMKGRPQPIHTCPHCDKAGGNAMLRWHFDNCKEKRP